MLRLFILVCSFFIIFTPSSKRLVLASKAAQGIKKVARLVVASPIKTRR